MNDNDFDGMITQNDLKKSDKVKTWLFPTVLDIRNIITGSDDPEEQKVAETTFYKSDIVKYDGGSIVLLFDVGKSHYKAIVPPGQNDKNVSDELSRI